MDGNHSLYTICFMKGILEMQEPPVPQEDAQPRTAAPQPRGGFWSRLFGRKTPTGHKPTLSRKQG